jgi:hypothetical protein
MKILCIVPQLPPAINGVGDYAHLLALQLWSDFKIKLDFIVTTPEWNIQDYQGPFKVVVLKKWQKQELIKEVSLLNPDKIFLNYVGYAYAKRGCPFWLTEALRSWKKNDPTRKLITFFHEIYAFGPIWTSQFWTSPFQRSIAQEMINLSDACLTSREEYAQIIQRFLHHSKKPVISMPVFSNIGEPQLILPLKKRKRQIVIFGQSAWRESVYRFSCEELRKTCKIFKIEEIIDIGPSISLPKHLFEELTIKFLGILPPEEISRIMQESMVGFMNYPLKYLAKSGIFAAYCSNAVLPVVVLNSPGDEDGLKMNQHYLTTQRLQEGIELDEAVLVAQRAYEWYQGHNLTLQAEFFNKNFLNMNLEK